MHFIPAPGALILAPVVKYVQTVTVDMVGFEMTDKNVLVVDEETSFSLLYASLVKPLILTRIWLSFRAESVLKIVRPFSLVLGPSGVYILAKAMGAVGKPVTIVLTAVSMDNPSFPVCLVVDPVSLEFRAVSPDLNTAAVSLPLWRKLAGVKGPVIQFHVFMRNRSFYR